MKLHEQLRLRREQLRLNQTELSAKSGIGQNTISYFEKGRKTPSLATIQKIVEAMGGKLTVVWETA